MTKVIGIIAEYNPFHNGHLLHLNQSLAIAGQDGADCYTVAVMSGSFVQRGEAALFDKWSRAAMAVRGGIDLVLELPFVFAVRSAHYFAAGGIRLLKNLGVVSHLSFGAEHADLGLLKLAAAQIDCPAAMAAFRQNLQTGKTYAAALAEALAGNTGLSPELLSSPNNILAIEYLRAINKYAPHLSPIAVLRRGASHHEQKITGTIASASAIRSQFFSGADNPFSIGKIASVVPPASARHISELLAAGCAPADYKCLDNIVLAKLRLKNFDEIANLPEVTEGMHYKIAAAALKASSLEELLTLLKSKRYLRTRLQRIMVHALLGTTKTDIAFFDEAGPLYARVLAFNEKGRSLLKEINRLAETPVISKTADYLTSKERGGGSLSPLKAMLAFDTLATDIYALSLPNVKFKSGGADFLNSPKYLPL